MMIRRHLLVLFAACLVLAPEFVIAESAPKNDKPLSFTLADGVILKLMPIPAGKFTMGSPESEEGHCGEEQQVEVTISHPFWMAETLFTQRQWEAVMRDNPSEFKGRNLPVETVGWYDCRKCVIKLNKRFKRKLPSGYRFALPTEAQWEYACRAGTTTAFHYGINLDSTMANVNENPPDEHGNLPDGDGKKGIFRMKTTPVKTFKPNSWGLYDMHGNLEQWCFDAVDADDDCISTLRARGTDPVSRSGRLRILRGGSWDSLIPASRSASRFECCPAKQVGGSGRSPDESSNAHDQPIRSMGFQPVNVQRVFNPLAFLCGEINHKGGDNGLKTRWTFTG